jgi:hypothetical protein
MHRPTYTALRSKYPDRRSVSAEELYRWIGYPSYVTDPRYANTCAIRMSLALVRCSVLVSPGRLRVLEGECKGRMLEPGQANLSRIMVRLWGAPEKYKGGMAAKKGIGNRCGVISFYRLWGPTDQQGHIDMVAPYGGDNLACEEDCYWMSAEAWFWPLR